MPAAVDRTTIDMDSNSRSLEREMISHFGLFCGLWPLKRGSCLLKTFCLKWSNANFLIFCSWRNPGTFVDYLGFTGSLEQFIGFWTTFSNAVSAYSKVEGISIAAAETQAARQNIPIAAKQIL